MAAARYLILAALVLTSVLLCSRPQELERGHYTAFHRSLVQDRDLNIVNQVDPPDRWLVTKTLNHPTHSSHGVTLLWSPFYAYADFLFPKRLHVDLRVMGLDSYQVLALVRNSFFLLIGFVLVIASIRQLGVRRTPAFPLSLAVLGTPLLWFFAFEPFNTDITLFFLSSILTFGAISTSSRSRPLLESFFIGIFFGIGSLVKASLLLLSPLLLIFLGHRIRQEPFLALKRAGSLALGASIPLALFSLNNFFHYGELLIFPQSVVFQTLESPRLLAVYYFFLSPNSLLLCSPAFFVAAGIAATHIGHDFKRRFVRLRDGFASRSSIIAFSLVTFLSAFFFLMRSVPVYGDIIPSRVLLVCLPPCLVLLGFVHERLGPFAKLSIILILIAGAVSQWLQAAQYVAYGTILRFPWVEPDLGPLANLLHDRWQLLLENSAEILPLLYFVPLIAALSWVSGRLIGLSRRALRSCFRPAFRVATAGCLLLYVAVTALNVANNRANAEQLRKMGFFDRSVISAGSPLHFYDEITSILEDAMNHLQPSEASSARAVYLKFLDSSARQISQDPIGFLKQYEKGEYRKSIWNQY